MKNNLPFLLIFPFLLVSCQEETPEILFGEYSLQSSQSEKAMDIIGDGQVSTNFMDQHNLLGNSESHFFLSLHSPGQFNVKFSQVTFNLPLHLEQNSDIILDRAYAGRKMEQAADGNISLSWSRVASSPNPNLLHDNIEVISFRKLEKSTNNLELIVNQSWFDYSQSSWEDTEITYVFSKR